jgi:hypothetical protein
VTFTDEQLWAAVRSAGRDGQSFTCATVRDVLGMSSKKRQELAQFRDRFRAFRLAAGDGIEKVGKTAYRLTGTRTEEGEMSEALFEFEVIAVADEAEEVAEATAPEVAEVSAPDIAEAFAPEVAEASAPEAVLALAVEATETSALEAAPVEVAERAPAMPYHPAAIEASDMGFGEPMGASAADSGELAANHVIFSAWPESMQQSGGPSDGAGIANGAAAQLTSQQTEAMIEAEVRDLVTTSEDRQPNAPESLIAQAEQTVIRTWRDSGHWLGRRFAELFSRTQN